MTEFSTHPSSAVQAERLLTHESTLEQLTAYSGKYIEDNSKRVKRLTVRNLPAVFNVAWVTIASNMEDVDVDLRPSTCQRLTVNHGLAIIKHRIGPGRPTLDRNATLDEQIIANLQQDMDDFTEPLLLAHKRGDQRTVACGDMDHEALTEMHERYFLRSAGFMLKLCVVASLSTSTDWLPKKLRQACAAEFDRYAAWYKAQQPQPTPDGAA